MLGVIFLFGLVVLCCFFKNLVGFCFIFGESFCGVFCFGFVGCFSLVEERCLKHLLKSYCSPLLQTCSKGFIDLYYWEPVSRHLSLNWSCSVF